MRVVRPQRTRYPWRWTAAFGLLAVLVVSGTVWLTVAPSDTAQADARTWTVDRTDDPFVAADVNGDGMNDAGPGTSTCGVAANDCSLRGALERANLNTGHLGTTAHTDTITFSVTGVITLAGGPLTLNDLGPNAGATTITGPTGFGITVTGSGSDCFRLIAPNGNTIQGLVINGCGDDGIEIQPTSDNNIIRANRIGTNAAGTAAVANTSNGIEIQLGSSGNTIGGTGAADGNVISGNTLEGILLAGGPLNTVAGNLIGTDSAGVSPIPNSDGIDVSGAGNTIGGTAAGSRNIISGNSDDGLEVDGSGNAIQGNCIGLQIDCASSRPNGGTGVQVGVFAAAPDNVIGGGTLGSGNVIGHNADMGVYVFGPGGGDDTVIRRNSIVGNGNCGIDLITPGANDGLGVGPAISNINFGGGSSFTVSGIPGSALPGATIDVYVGALDAPSPCTGPGPGDGSGPPPAPATAEGSCWVGTTSAAGDGSWSATVNNIGGATIVVTQTNAFGSTSEFGPPSSAPAGPGPGACPLPAAAAPPTPTPVPATNTPTTAPATNTPTTAATATVTGTPPTATPTRTPTAGPQETVSLVGGCQIVTSTEDLDTAELRTRFSPAYNTAWLLVAATGAWLGDSPTAADPMVSPNDLPGVDRLDGFFACMPAGGGTFTRAQL